MQSIDVSQEQQRAIVGHSIKDQKFYRQCKMLGGVQLNLDPRVQSLWVGLEAFYSKFKRHPKAKELQEICFEGQDKNGRDAIIAAVKNSLEAAGGIGQDVALESLKETAIQQTRHKGLEQVLLLHETDSTAANAKLGNTLRDITRLEGLGTRVSGVDALDRYEVARKAANVDPIKLGITYLDDTLHGIRQHELMIVAAATGAGKTALVSTIAGNVLAAGKKVTMLALEAYEGEIHHRLLYGIIADLYYAKNNSHIAYDEWHHGMLDAKLAPYEAEAKLIFADRYKNLTIRYRSPSEPYDVDQMEKDIVQAAETSDLVILDHVHYIDGDEGLDDNRNMVKIMNRLRGLCDSLHIPIIAAAHLSKDGASSRNGELLPSVHAIHGSSIISKVASSVVMLGPARMFVPKGETPDSGLPAYTFIRAVKNRLAGAKTWPTCVALFDPRRNAYLPQYAYGRLVKGDRYWEPDDKIPHWATKNGTVQLQGTEMAAKLDDAQKKVATAVFERDLRSKNGFRS